MTQIITTPPRQFIWKEHGVGFPVEMYAQILKDMKPFQLLVASQINKGWHSQIDCEWSELDTLTKNQLASIQKANKFWSKHTLLKGSDFVKLQRQRVLQGYTNIKNGYGFINEELTEILALYQNLFLRFNEFTLKKAISVFHKHFGMPIEQVTGKYFKSHKTGFDIQIGSLSYLKDLSENSHQKFIRSCIDHGQRELVLSHLNNNLSDFQKLQLHDCALELFNRTKQTGQKPDLEVLLNDFFERACKEIESNPNSQLSLKLKPKVERILQEADESAELMEDFVYDIIVAPRRIYYPVKWLLGFGWDLSVSKAFTFEIIARACGYLAREATFEIVKSELIKDLISAFPEYLEWQNEIFHLCELHQMIERAKRSFEKSNFCFLSQKLLTEAVLAPDGKLYNVSAIFTELDNTPKKFTFSKRDLKPDFEKIHQVYENIIKGMRLYLKEEGDKRTHGWIPVELDRYGHLAHNVNILTQLLRLGKRANFGKVQQLCTKEQSKYLKENKHLRHLHAEGKISELEFQNYNKYSNLKREITEDYHFNFALRNPVSDTYA